MNNPFTFDPTRHGYIESDDIGLFSPEDAYEMGVSTGWAFVKEAVLVSQHPGNCENCGHLSDCALHNEPAFPRDFCNCGKFPAVSTSTESETADV